MELRHLRYFCAVAETLNFSKAAARMHVAQSALSRQIRDLEDELGVQLLVRTTVSVRLTDAGTYFFQATQKILAQTAIAASGAQQIAGGKVGEFNIASDWRLPIHLVSETARKFRLANPKVNANFVELAMAEQIEALHSGKIHIGFVPDMILGAKRNLEHLHIYTGRMVVAVPASHRFAKRPVIALGELSREKWVAIKEERNASVSGYKIYLTQLCRLAGFTPLWGSSASGTSGMLSLVAAGEGVALIPEDVAPADLRGIHLANTDCPLFEIHAVWLRKATSPLVANYVDILRHEVDGVKLG